MAATTIATTIDVRAAGNYSLNSHEARGMKMKTGYVTFDGGDYVSGGISWTPPGMPALAFITFNNVDGYVVEYDYDNSKIQVYEAGADADTPPSLDEYAAAAISLVIRFFAIAY